MKQFLLIACSILAIVTTSCSQKLNVPAAVTKAFNDKYPNAANLKWGKESANEYEAEFKLNGTNVSANFGSDGSWVETETTLKVSDLPAAVSDAIKKNYPGAVITTAEKLEEPGNKLLYETVIKVNGKKKDTGAERRRDDSEIIFLQNCRHYYRCRHLIFINKV